MLAEEGGSPLQIYVFFEILIIACTIPKRESMDCELLTESWLLSLSSAAESRPLWLSTAEAPLDSRAAICGQKTSWPCLFQWQQQVNRCRSFHFLTRILTLFCRLSSCSLYHLSFSSRVFFSSSSFFTKSISLLGIWKMLLQEDVFLVMT